MTQVESLISEIEAARTRYLAVVGNISEEQANWKPSPDVWNIIEITEHLFWAEHGGLAGMWKVLSAKREGQPLWTGELIHKGLSIEEVVARTWQTKEQVPAVAAPRMGGTIGFWAAALQSLEVILHKLGEALASEEDLESIIHPHPISGPIDIRQRLEFLRFHIDRHRDQALALLQ